MMNSRLWHVFLVFTLLNCLLLLSGISGNSRAIRSSKPPIHEFPSSGYGIATAHMIRRSAIPQVRDTEQGIANLHYALKSTGTVPALQNVVSVPQATSVGPSAVEGIADDGKSKPDANGVGGTNNYLETVNNSLAFYSRKGTVQYTTSFQAWFGVPDTWKFFDPVVAWDRIGGRFIFSVDNGRNLFLSVAQQAGGGGNFCNYIFPTVSKSGSGADFDKLGINTIGIYLSANILDPNSGYQISNELFFASRTQLESCTRNISYTTWTGLTNPDGSLASAIVPAVDDSSTPEATEYLVNSYPGGACQLTLWTFTDSGNLSNQAIPTQCYGPPTNAEQEGSPSLIQTGDCSLTQVSDVNGLLTLAMNGSYDWGDGNGPVGIIEWFVLNANSASVYNQGAFGTPGFWLFYPAAVQNRVGNMLFVYDASGPTIFPSIWYVNQTYTGTLALAQGNSYYTTPYGSLWGDYSSAWLDAGGNYPNSVWITSEYAKATNFWGTSFGLTTP